MSSTPWFASSATMPAGSGQQSGLSAKSPICSQWNQSITIIASGSPRAQWPRATSSSCVWFRYRSLHWMKPVAQYGIGRGEPTAAAYRPSRSRSAAPASAAAFNARRGREPHVGAARRVRDPRDGARAERDRAERGLCHTNAPARRDVERHRHVGAAPSARSRAVGEDARERRALHAAVAVLAEAVHALVRADAGEGRARAAARARAARRGAPLERRLPQQRRAVQTRAAVMSDVAGSTSTRRLPLVSETSSLAPAPPWSATIGGSTTSASPARRRARGSRSRPTPRAARPRRAAAAGEEQHDEARRGACRQVLAGSVGSGARLR